MSPIDEVKSDITTVMTIILQRAFRAARCDPGCHCCSASIEVGDYFKLAIVEDNDEMLCDTCTVEDLLKKRSDIAEKIERSRRGFTRKRSV